MCNYMTQAAEELQKSITKLTHDINLFEKLGPQDPLRMLNAVAYQKWIVDLPFQTNLLNSLSLSQFMQLQFIELSDNTDINDYETTAIAQAQTYTQGSCNRVAGCGDDLGKVVQGNLAKYVTLSAPNDKKTFTPSPYFTTKQTCIDTTTITGVLATLVDLQKKLHAANSELAEARRRIQQKGQVQTTLPFQLRLIEKLKQIGVMIFWAHFNSRCKPLTKKC